MSKKKKADEPQSEGNQQADEPQSEGNQQFKAVASVVAMGKLFADGDLKKENDWAVRMMKAGLEGYGLTMPQDWDTLSEEEKARRIAGVMKILKED